MIYTTTTRSSNSLRPDYAWVSIAMFENDSIQSFQRSSAKKTKAKGVTSATKQSKDDFIMDTNNSSIVSKRSVEKLYWTGEPEFFRYFVSKFKRRSPLINRGYWLRVRAVESTVEKFLSEPSGKHKLVINLGCGYDPLPWLFLGKRAHLCHDATFIDVDYPQLMLKKVDTILKTPQLCDLLPGLSSTSSKDGLLCRSTNYAAVGCDLRNLDFLHFVLREQLGIETCKVAILFVAEVSIAYMDYDGSQAVIQWASSYEDVRFCLLEQHLPDGRDHPFAQTMLKHFDKLRTPLHAIGTMDDMKRRFASAGWPENHIGIQSLWSFWSDDNSITPQERQSLDGIEPFDEWEEFALFASHYFLLVAVKTPADKQRQIYTPSHPALVSRQYQSNETVHCKPISTPSSHRRFSALIPPSQRGGNIGIHAGLGTKERLTDTATYTSTLAPQPTDGPPSLNGLMCHTITRFNASGDCLLVGGRASPTEVSARCWHRSSGRWREADPLPRGRYRHQAFRVVDSSGQSGVVVISGKASDGSLIKEILHWSEKTGWIAMPCQTNMPPMRFGAIAVPDDDSGRSGLYLGGIGEDRVVLTDMWRWRIDEELNISFVELDDDSQQQLSIGRPDLLWRFGAQVVNRRTSDGSAERWLVGGIAGGQMLTRETEIVSLDDFKSLPIQGSRPLFIGVNLHDQLCTGGGATCFSFGTYWSDSVMLHRESEDAPQADWRLLSHRARPMETSKSSNAFTNDLDRGSLVAIAPRSVDTSDDFKRILSDRRPVIIRGCSIGECVEKWTPQYLKATIGGDRIVSVHSATTQKMDFQSKNFTYEQQNFGTFIDNVEKGELHYLRALSATSPSEEPTVLSRDYPEIADDFKLPSQLQYVLQNAHSSPLRVSSRVTMWLHYDVMANVLCQVRGRKRLFLFPPSDVVHLGFEAGASSSSLDVFDASEDSTKAVLERCQAHEAMLEPGDILFIPPLWLHTAAPSDSISVAINVFFRDLQSGYAAGRDVYGNRDLAAYERGRKEVGKLAKSFAGLPADISRFYLERLAAELMSMARSA